MKRSHVLTPLLLLALLGLPVAAQADAPGLIPVQGTLYDTDGVPIDDTLSVTFTLYADADATTPLWSTSRTVTFVGGLFTVYLGETDPLNLVIFDDYDRVWIGVAVDGDSEMALFDVATAPYAGYAQYCGDADTLNGQTAEQIRDAAVAGTAGLYRDASWTPAWGDIRSVPSGFADGVDNTIPDTTLSEGQVEGFVRDMTVGWNGGANCFTWTSYQNSWDNPLNFSCPTNQVLTGISSYHDNDREDRLWRFRCCALDVQ